MSQFQPIPLGQTVQIPSQQQQQILQQQNQCQQYQLEPCDIKPQFSLIPTVSQNLTNNNNNSGNNMNISQSGIGNFGALMTTLDTVVSGMNNNNNNNNNNTGGGQAGQFATPMNHTDVASLLMNPSKRAETFVIDEVKVMLKEIEARKHILLSLSPSTNRLKRRAWEDVAMSMAARWPHAPRRTADQVKKKWENLVSKTKRKVRAGHITPELDWNETNAAVMQFLTQHSPPVRLRYLSSIGPSLLSLGDLQASSASASGSALTTSGSATTAMNGGGVGGGINAFNQTNSHIYGLSNTSFTDPYSTNNHNNNSSIFSNNQHSSLMLSSEKSAILDSCLRQESINSSNNNNNNSSSNSNNNTTNNACSSSSNSNNNSINGQHSFINHETNDLNSFNNAGSGGGGPGAGGGDKQQHLNTSTVDKDVDMTTGNNNNSSNNINNKSQNHGDSSEVVGNITGSVNESFLSSFSPFNQSFLNFGLPASNHHDSLYTTFNQDIQKELYSQLKQEHELRMDILRLQKQAWLLQMNLFKKMKVEQISSLFSSPQLSLPTTTTTPTTPPSNTTTTNSVVSSSTNSTGCSNTSVSTSLSSSNEVNHSAMNTSTSVPSINPSTTPVTASLTTTPTAATTATTTSITKPNSSSQQPNVNHQSESNSTSETRSLSPMFPGDANSNPHQHQNVVLTNVEKIEG